MAEKKIVNQHVLNETQEAQETEEDRNAATDYKVYTREPDGSIDTKAPVSEYKGHVNLHDAKDDENADR